jgi:hypothetical protein
MKKTIKTVGMAMLCFASRDGQSSLKARSQEKNPIRVLAPLMFEELKLIVGFPHTLYFHPLPLPIYEHFK